LNGGAIAQPNHCLRGARREVTTRVSSKKGKSLKQKKKKTPRPRSAQIKKRKRGALQGVSLSSIGVNPCGNLTQRRGLTAFASRASSLA